MIYGMGWTYSNKNEKLDILRQECGALEMRNDRLAEKLDRLMAHLGLVETRGPRIEQAPDMVNFL